MPSKPRKVYMRLYAMPSLVPTMACRLLFGVKASSEPMQASPWWRHQMETFSEKLALCAGNSPVPVNSPHKGQWRGALMFSLICVWINGWVNNGEAGDLRRHRGHYDVSVMVNRILGNKFQWNLNLNTASFISNMHLKYRLRNLSGPQHDRELMYMTNRDCNACNK